MTNHRALLVGADSDEENPSFDTHNGDAGSGASGNPPNKQTSQQAPAAPPQQAQPSWLSAFCQRFWAVAGSQPAAPTRAASAAQHSAGDVSARAHISTAQQSRPQQSTQPDAVSSSDQARLHQSVAEQAGVSAHPISPGISPLMVSHQPAEPSTPQIQPRLPIQSHPTSAGSHVESVAPEVTPVMAVVQNASSAETALPPRMDSPLDHYLIRNRWRDHQPPASAHPKSQVHPVATPPAPSAAPQEPGTGRSQHRQMDPEALQQLMAAHSSVHPEPSPQCSSSCMPGSASRGPARSNPSQLLAERLSGIDALSDSSDDSGEEVSSFRPVSAQRYEFHYDAPQSSKDSLLVRFANFALLRACARAVVACTCKSRCCTHRCFSLHACERTHSLTCFGF